MPDKVIYCYSIHQPIFDTLKDDENVQFVRGFDVTDIFPDADDDEDDMKQNNGNKDKPNRLLILDDLHDEISPLILSKIFTKLSHHYSTSVIFIVQFLFMKIKCMRECSVNTMYNFIFRSPKDLVSLRVLNSQMGFKPGFLTTCFLDATKSKYGYLMLDANPQSDPDLRVRTGIFPGDEIKIYKPTNE